MPFDLAVGKAIVKVCNECRRPEFPIEMYDDDDIDVFKSGQVVRPDNPFFVAKIRRSRRNELVSLISLICSTIYTIVHKSTCTRTHSGCMMVRC